MVIDIPKILIVDDEWLTRLEIDEMLTDLGYEVVGQAETGVEAVDMAGNLEPDLIIMDVMMPGEMNGIDAARVIKAEWGTPIIFVTGYDDPEHIEAAKEIAPFGYVMKPFDQKEIHASVEIALSKRALELKLKKAHEGLESSNLILQEEIAARKEMERALLENNELLQTITDTALDSIFCKNINRQYTFVNSAMIQLLGSTREDLIGKAPEQVFDKNEAAIVNEVDARALNGEKVSEVRTLSIAGRRHIFHTIQVPLRNADGRITGISGIVRDITDSNHVQEAFRDRERYLSAILETTRDGFWLLDKQGRITDVNETYCQMSGYSRKELLQLGIPDLEVDETPDETAARIKRIKENGSELFETRHRRKDGSIFNVELSVTWLDRDPQSFVCFCRDITDRKGSEKALRKSERLLSIKNRIAEIFLTIPDEKMYGEVLQVVLKALESPYGTFAYIDENGDRVVPSMTRDIWDECKIPDKGIFFPRAQWGDTLWARAIIEKKSFSSNGPFKIPDGHMPIRRALASPIIYKGEVIGNLMVGDKSSDYTGNEMELLEKVAGRIAPVLNARLLNERNEKERKRAEAALRESQQRYSSLFKNMLNGFAYCQMLYKNDAPDDFIYLEVNKAFEELTGLKNVTGKRVSEVIPRIKEETPELFEIYSRVSETGRPEQFEINFTPLKIWLYISVYSPQNGYFAAVFENITERKREQKEKERLQSLLQQSQKMEAIGTLAGGIAHDFNNILAIILGNAQLASDDFPDSSLARECLEEICKASVRAKNMVRQLLTFSRKADEENLPLNIAPVIKESMKMLRSAIPTSVEFKEQISNDACYIMGDAAQINQIVMNLVANAADAMSQEGGLLEVAVEKIFLQEEKICFHWVLSPGAYIRLRMRDTGKGIDPKIMDRIFEPYYTTKEVGKGTGMGLSVLHGIVNRNGGGIRVESELGKGTLFEIYFPALENMAEKENEPTGEIKGGSERILFVDDEESLVKLNHQRLERLGYQIKSTTKPLDALEWFKADPNRFDVIISDMTMPRMTGDRLSAEVMKIRPGMPVIICTGYSENLSAEKAEALGVRKYIEKPIDLRDLASSLREVLD